jgi:lysophospholipase L1-like esterase
VPRRLRRLLAIGAGLFVGFVVLLVVEVQLARSGPRLADEDGSRPQGLVVGTDRSGVPIEVVWLGDSTTTGVGVDDFDDSMANRTAVATADVLDRPVSLTVLGVSGARIDAVADEQAADLEQADVVVISVGANDVTHLTNRATFRTRYATLLDHVEATTPDAEIVLVGIPDMGSVPRFAQPLRAIAGVRASQLDDDVRSAARSRGLQYVDLAGDTGPRFRADPDRYFSDDGFHPGIAGHGLWAESARGEIVTAARQALG